METAKEGREPIQQSVRVDCPIEDAFRLFTQRLAEWWPLAPHSIAGEQAEDCAIEPWAGGRIFERTRSGEELEWGCVTVWDPPERLEFTWRDDSQRVNIAFRVEADGTRVTLIHQGWDISGVQASALSSFANFVFEQMAVMA